jgi:hypothetical protein
VVGIAAGVTASLVVVAIVAAIACVAVFFYTRHPRSSRGGSSDMMTDSNATLMCDMSSMSRTMGHQEQMNDLYSPNVDVFGADTRKKSNK